METHPQCSRGLRDAGQGKVCHSSHTSWLAWMKCRHRHLDSSASCNSPSTTGKWHCSPVVQRREEKEKKNKAVQTTEKQILGKQFSAL